MRVSFSASDAWLRDCLAQSEGFVVPSGDAQNAKLFDLLVPLYDHGGADPRSNTQYISRIHQLLSGDDSTRARDIFPCMTLPEFLRSAEKAIGFRPSMRNTAIVIDTANAFTQHFLPPGAQRAKAAAHFLLKISYARLSGRRDVGAALTTYFLFLTIHPLLDGNGRTARRLFASCVADHEDSPVLVLALALLHQRSATNFHLACKIARLGDMSHLLDRFRESIASVHTIFGRNLEALNRALDATQYDHDLIIDQLLQIRNRAQLYFSH